MAKRLFHGKRYTPVYRAWNDIKSRCYNKKHRNYSNYGGKGIIVCDRWKNSFTKFYEDMGDRPIGARFARIDTNKDFQLNNCFWKISKISRTTKNSRDGIEQIERVWNDIIDKCYNPKSVNYKNFGSKGIQVCYRWRNSLDLFYRDAGDRPGEKILTRLDNNGDFNPSNCVWVDKAKSVKRK